MSDGLSDARAQEDLCEGVRHAARRLAKRLRAARVGHRGWRPDGGELLDTLDAALEPLGLKVTVYDKGKWEAPSA